MSMKSKYRRRVKSSLKKGRDLIKKSLTYEELSDNILKAIKFFLKPSSEISRNPFAWTYTEVIVKESSFKYS